MTGVPTSMSNFSLLVNNLVSDLDPDLGCIDLSQDTALGLIGMSEDSNISVNGMSSLQFPLPGSDSDLFDHPSLQGPPTN